jgi:predicted nucleotidyltransferase
MIVTVAERKAKEVDALRTGSKGAIAELRAYAKQHGGRFLLFGSMATGRCNYDSDIDLIIDFKPPNDRTAYLEAEKICRRHGLTPDLHYLAQMSGKLLGRAEQDWVVIQ